MAMNFGRDGSLDKFRDVLSHSLGHKSTHILTAV